MGFEKRMASANRAEAAVRKFFEDRGWCVSKINIRDILEEKHNHELSIGNKRDLVSLYVRHFPDHIATKKISILIQTKWSPPDREIFFAEADCLNVMSMLFPFDEQMILVYWVEDENKFYGETMNHISEIIKNKEVHPGSINGSGTPYYIFDKSEFIDLNQLIENFEK